MKGWNETSKKVIEKLPKLFTLDVLNNIITALQMNDANLYDEVAIKNILWLADSNYFIKFEEKNDISERVIFPVSKNENKGIEDARFVQFFDDNGEVTY